MKSDRKLREDALAIWLSGVRGVLPDRLIEENLFLSLEDSRPELWIGDVPYSLSKTDRIIVIGAGKASGKMAEAIETIFEPVLDSKLKTGPDFSLSGWVNVPDDCVQKLRFIHLHGARASARNEPTEAGVQGSEKIRDLLLSLGPNDICIALISGGGSALLPLPVEGITLEEKLELAGSLSECGANIEEINIVRKQCGLLKGGGLRKLCEGKTLIGLVLSDVPGNPLDVIASGPCVPDTSTPADAISVLKRYSLDRKFSGLVEFLQRKTVFTGSSQPGRIVRSGEVIADHRGGTALNLVIGSNAIAVDEAGIEAEKRGYSHTMISSPEPEGGAEELGRELAELALRMRHEGPDCLISGGEPVVKLAPAEVRGLGGRNQQLVLAALKHLREHREFFEGEPLRLAFLSGGTDGEDGPSDAAGAMFDQFVFDDVPEELGLDDFLLRNDAYRFFERYGGLLKTGATGTNVCDIRVIVAAR